MNVRQTIAELYGEKFLRKSALNIRGGAGVFEKVMAGKGHKTALEIGTYRGVSAAEMAQYCERVITIDLKHGKLEQNGGTFGRQHFWKSLGIENIELHLIDDDVEKARLIDSLSFDFAFVDGAHDETVANDFALVKKCGNVLFHDYDSRGRPELDYVYDFVNSLPKHQVEIIDIFAMWRG